MTRWTAWQKLQAQQLITVQERRGGQLGSRAQEAQDP